MVCFYIITIIYFVRRCAAWTSHFLLLAQKKVTKEKGTRRRKPHGLLVHVLGQSADRASLSSLLTGGVHAATLRAQPALMQRKHVAPAWGFFTGVINNEIAKSRNLTIVWNRSHAITVSGDWLNASGARRGEARMPSLTAETGMSHLSAPLSIAKTPRTPGKSRGDFLCLLSLFGQRKWVAKGAQRRAKGL